MRTIDIKQALFLLLRRVLVSLSAAAIPLAASGQTISLHADNVSRQEAIMQIQKEYGYSFAMNMSEVDLSEKVSVDLENEEIGTVIQELFKGKPVECTVSGKTIVVSLRSSVTASSGKRPGVEMERQIPENYVLKGIVVDESGQPVPGATVMVPESTNGTVTDLDGSFEIVLDGDCEIECVCLGYETVIMSVTSNTGNVKIILKQSSEYLDEVVVVGYGTMRRSLVTSAISKVEIDDDMMRSVSSPAELLNGRVAGVTSFTGSGNLGSGERMSIRGASSISAGNEPLYVIDGVPIMNSDANITDFGESMSTLAMLNLNDIESIEILKDAASAAIYGSRATNGVVLITTRSGADGTSDFRVNLTTGLSQFPNIDKVRMATSEQYIAAYNDGVDNYNKQYGLSVGDANYKTHISNPFGTMEDYDWMRAITQLGKFYTADISFSGGNKKTNFYLGASASYKEGIIRTNSMDKINLSAKVNHKFGNWLEIGTTNSANYMKNNQIPGANSGAMIIGRAILQRPYDRPYAPDGSYFVGGTDALTYHNGIQILNEEIAYLQNMRYIGSYYATLKFWQEKITFKNSFNADILSLYDYTNYLSTHPYGLGVGLITDRNQTSINYTIENVLNYNDEFFDKSLTLNAMLGHSFFSRSYHNASIQATDFPSPSLDVVGVGTYYSHSGSMGEYTMESYFGRISSSYKGRYLLTATLRTDGSSKFAKDYRWGWFPSVSLGWNITNEPFMENIKDRGTDLKFRISYGKTGNQEGIGNYAYQPKLTAGYGYDKQAGFAVSDFGNDDLTWEKADQYDIGMDMGFFHDRLTIIVDAYLKNTTDLLYSMPVHALTGRSTMLTNIGSMRNKGVELTIGGSVNLGPVHWETNFNISRNVNEITALLDDDEPIIASNRILEKGRSINCFNLFKQEGIYQYDAEVPLPQYEQGVRAGDVKWYDHDGNGVIDDSDRVPMGDADPDFFGGWSNTFSWKGLSLNIFFTYMYGNQVLMGQGTNLTRSAHTRGVVAEYVENAWSGPGSTNTYPRNIVGYSFNQRNSDMILFDGSFIRLRALTLSYNFPSKILNKIKMKGLRVYVQGDNLFLLTRYPGWDPEVSNNLDPRYTGTDNLNVPQPRTYTFGLNLTF